MIYNYMADKLIEANLKKDPSIIKEVIRILEDISQAWNETLKKPSKTYYAKSTKSYGLREKYISR